MATTWFLLDLWRHTIGFWTVVPWFRLLEISIQNAAWPQEKFWLHIFDTLTEMSRAILNKLLSCVFNFHVYRLPWTFRLSKRTSWSVQLRLWRTNTLFKSSWQFWCNFDTWNHRMICSIISLIWMQVLLINVLFSSWHITVCRQSISLLPLPIQSILISLFILPIYF